MSLIYNVAPFTVRSETSVTDAMRMLDANKRGFLIVTDEDDRVVGTVTDGDIRRLIIETGDLPDRISQAMRHRFSFVYSDEPNSQSFTDRIKFLPVIDRKTRRLTAISLPGKSTLEIDGHQISNDYPPFIIAEIGNNHNGSLSVAKEMIDAAAQAGADCVKFQYREMAHLYRDSAGAGDANDLGVEYTLDLLARFQLSREDITEAFDYARSKDIVVMCTPWDKQALKVLEEYGMSAYKVASADLTNIPLIEAIADTRKAILLSTGMSHEWEIKRTIAVLESRHAEYALLHCNSTYPAPFKDVNLAYLNTLKNLHDGIVGYSGHERGIEVPIAATAMGARIIEKHFTFYRSWEGNDHKVSLLPDEFAAMVQGIHNVHEAMGGGEKFLSQGELINRETLSKSIIAKCPIEKGQVIQASDLDIRSPGQGLQPNRISDLLGRPAVRAKKMGEYFFEFDLDPADDDEVDTVSFDRPAGIPVRYHDAKRLVDGRTLDFVEFHLSYSDLQVDPTKALDDFPLQEFAVHAPELFENDHILDLSTDNETYRDQSIAHLRRVITETQRLRRILTPQADKTYIVVNAGGFSIDGFLPADVVKKKYDRVAEAYAELASPEIELLIQTMPPFPWHFGGQRYHNLFCEPDQILDFHNRTGARICLDVSHTCMSATHFGFDFYEACEMLAPLSPHMHIVDAYGLDGEGVAIGEGDVNFARLADILRRQSPNAMFIPEIWQGHKNNGEGFWEALKFLNNFKL
ncbi:N-acetylneuraminate synthase family protein [Fontisubflavum oceani]|uniref:N-acetylneuraminate synthase family protein n=1 Tax=Fontisubflavum oceani TaxID=2978973 RepID=UPI0025B566DC|nr:N-acetylneuraminate synthase family protein [Fontisubflavum oceani]WJY20966.1 N-acetylneuraminate synthase family protein [Fontisubflavum oceani]